jgi:hypothetical protein
MFSRYTILIYLNISSYGDCIFLNIDGENLNTRDCGNSGIANFGQSCKVIIFDQKYEHTGYPFRHSDKFFIRSDLIYSNIVDKLEYKDTASKMFNMACYMTKQCTLNKELINYTSQLFNATCKIRCQIEYDDIPTKYLHKTFSLGNFITNGNDYWFRNDMDLKTCALSCILDYFSAKINSEKIIFETKFPDIPSFESVYDALNLNDKNTVDNFNYSNKDFIEKYELEKWEENLREELCNYKIENCNNNINKKKQKYSIVIMDNHIEINIDDIIVTDNKIIFDKTGLHNRVNFASAWNEGIPLESRIIDYVDSNIYGYSLPHISYIAEDKGYHLTIDMFNNNFVYKTSFKKVVDFIPQLPRRDFLFLKYLLFVQIINSFI